jgi:hypothetical protein
VQDVEDEGAEQGACRHTQSEQNENDPDQPGGLQRRRFFDRRAGVESNIGHEPGLDPSTHAT